MYAFQSTYCTTENTLQTRDIAVRKHMKGDDFSISHVSVLDKQQHAIRPRFTLKSISLQLEIAPDLTRTRLGAKAFEDSFIFLASDERSQKLFF